MEESGEKLREKPQTIAEAVERLRALVPPIILVEEFSNSLWQDIERNSLRSLDDITDLLLSGVTLRISLRELLAAYAINHVCQRLCRQVALPPDIAENLRQVPGAIKNLLRDMRIITDREVRGERLGESESALLRKTIDNIVAFVKNDLEVPVETTDYNQPFVRLL